MRIIQVKEYTKADGTVVHAHTRQIDDTVATIENNDKQGTLDLINELLPNIPDTKNELAKMIADGLEPEHHNEIMDELQLLQSFQNEVGKYRQLAQNGLDTSDTENNILNLLKGEVTGGASSVNTEYDKLPLSEKAQLNWKMNIAAKKLVPNTVNGINNSVNDLKSAKQDPNAKIISNFDEIKNNDFKNTLKGLGITENDKGVIYNQDTKLSKSMAKSQTVKNFINDNIDKIKSGTLQTVPISFNWHDDLNFNQFDMHAHIHNATVYNPKIIGNTVIMKVIDRCDYINQDGTGFLNENNNEMARWQNMGVSKPYYSITEVSVDLNDIKKKKINRHMKF